LDKIETKIDQISTPNKDNNRVFSIVGAILVLVVIAGVGTFGYFYYANQKIVKENETKISEQNKKYPAKTIIKDTADPNIKVTTPAQKDTVLVKNESGDMVEILKNTVPEKK